MNIGWDGWSLKSVSPNTEIDGESMKDAVAKAKEAGELPLSVFYYTYVAKMIADSFTETYSNISFTEESVRISEVVSGRKTSNYILIGRDGLIEHDGDLYFAHALKEANVKIKTDRENIKTYDISVD